MSNQTSFEITLRSKKIGMETVMDFYDLPAASQEAIIRYGAMRFINDKIGGLDLPEAKKAFDSILAQLKEGWIGRSASASASPVDPLEAELNKLAWNRIKILLKQKGIPLKQIGAEKKSELISQVLDKYREELLPQAQAIVDARKDSLSLGLGLDLGLG